MALRYQNPNTKIILYHSLMNASLSSLEKRKQPGTALSLKKSLCMSCTQTNLKGKLHRKSKIQLWQTPYNIVGGKKKNTVQKNAGYPLKWPKTTLQEMDHTM